MPASHSAAAAVGLPLAWVTHRAAWAGVREPSLTVTNDAPSTARALSLLPLPIDQSVAESWARLRIMLRERGARTPVNDSWIAATARARGVPVVTRGADYAGVPGLQFLRV